MLRAAGDRSYRLPCLLDVPVFAAELGQPRTAVRLLGAADALAETLGVTGLAPASRQGEELVLEAISGGSHPRR